MKPAGYRRGWHERRFPGQVVPAMGSKSLGIKRQCHPFRLETRARELIVMARLSLKRRSRRETEFSQHCEEKRVKVR